MPNLKRLILILFCGSIFLTACSTKNLENSTSSQTSESPTPVESSLSRTDEVYISLDIACEYVRKGFAYTGKDVIDAEVNFDVAADTFREVILDFSIAQQFMDGSIAASREIHRWANGRSLLQGAKDGHYIRGKDADSIVSLYNYCVASDLTASDG
jgi:hypothetical protein